MDELMYDKTALKIFDNVKTRKKYTLIFYEYESYFKNELIEICIIEGSNLALSNILDKINSNKNLSLDEIDNIINDEKENFKKSMNKYLLNMQNANNVYNASLNMSEELIKKFDSEYYDYIYKYNPLLKLRPTKEHIAFSNIIDNLYIEGKYSLFVMYYNAFKSKYNENDKTEIELYKKLESICECVDEFERLNKIVNFGKSIEQRNVFENDITILAEKAEFRVKKTQLLKTNNDLHKKLIEIYGEDVDFSFKA